MSKKTNRVTITENGPLGFAGELSLNGEATEETWLCRCGLSRKKPSCDGSHTASFADDGLPAAGQASSEGEGALKITTVKDGPILTQGPLTIVNSRGDVVDTVKKAAFCRCGASQNKPYCDGRHTQSGFQAN